MVQWSIVISNLPVKTFWIIGLATDMRPIPPAETAPQALFLFLQQFFDETLAKVIRFWSYMYICRNSTTGLFLHLQQRFDENWQKLSVLILYILYIWHKKRKSWLTNRAHVHEPKCGGRGGFVGSYPRSTAVLRSPNKLWRSNSILNLWEKWREKLQLIFLWWG